MNKIGVVGHGFVGLAVETGLQKVAEVSVYDKYKDTESLDTVVANNNILFLCLPTPMDPDTGECNLSILKSVVSQICKMSEKRKILIVKSTVPPGTTDNLQVAHPEHTFVFNPEFLTEAKFIEDFLNQDRIVIGCRDKSKILPLIKLYEDFTKTQKQPATIIYCKPSEAEMVKYTANCFLATKVSFFNEIWEICQKLKIDYNKMMEVCLLDKRIGNTHWKVPGHDGKRGWGLSCFPKDLNAIKYLANEVGVDTIMLEATWIKNLMCREDYDWEKLSQVTGEYKKK